eukprot:7893501-Alexandrium_andersonii.AAC.1
MWAGGGGSVSWGVRMYASRTCVPRCRASAPPPAGRGVATGALAGTCMDLSLIHISEPTRLALI